jgi:flagellar biosynthesis protein FlhB
MIILVLIEAAKDDPLNLSQAVGFVEIYAFRITMVSFTLTWCFRNVFLEIMDCIKKTRLGRQEMKHELNRELRALEREDKGGDQ